MKSMKPAWTEQCCHAQQNGWYAVWQLLHWVLAPIHCLQYSKLAGEVDHKHSQTNRFSLEGIQLGLNSPAAAQHVVS